MLTHMLIAQQKQNVPDIVAKTHTCVREIQMTKVVKWVTLALPKVHGVKVVQTSAINLATLRLKSSVPLHLTAKVVKEVQHVLQKILGAQQFVQFIVMRTK